MSGGFDDAAKEPLSPVPKPPAHPEIGATEPFAGLNVADVPSPAFVVDTARLVANAETLAAVRDAADVHILLALKGFALYHTFQAISPYLDGTTSSGIHEALLAKEFFPGEVHAYSPGFMRDEIEALVRFADHLVFNSMAQWRLAKPLIDASGRDIRCGLRVNPEVSTQSTPLYDPCAPGSRLGITAAQLAKASADDLSGISGLHFHALCEQNADALEATLGGFYERFAPWLDDLHWVNFGGGHHITRPDYDIDRLLRLLAEAKTRLPGRDVYLEPGEAVALNTGVLVATVLDVVHNAMPIAILDCSVTAHMPDVLEMPYRAEIVGAGMPGEKAHTYRLGGTTCLAGDVLGDYSFDTPLKAGDRIVLTDMAHYTMVKTTTFNGVRLPHIVVYDSRTGQMDVVRKPSYRDYVDRLG